MSNKPSWIILHHSGGTDRDPLADTSNQTFEDINEWHRLNPNTNPGFPSSLGYFCGYHYVIEKSGRLVQARSDFEGGCHTKGMNYASIGICIVGNFDSTLPSDAQIHTLWNLLDKLQQRYLIPSSKIVPHRVFAPKSCFGKNLGPIWGEEVLQKGVFADGFVRGILKQLVKLKYVIQPRVVLLFSAVSSVGALNDYYTE